MKEWMPENPIGGGFSVSAGQHWAWDKGSITGAKAVLEYIQKKNAESENFSGSINRLIHQMLKELEE